MKHCIIATLALMAAIPSAGQSSELMPVNLIRPRSSVEREGRFAYGRKPALYVGRSLSHPLLAAVERLKTRLQCSAFVPPANSSLQPPYVLIGLSRDHPDLGKLRSHAKTPRDGLGAEGYVIDVTTDSVLLVADRQAGLYRGITRLTEMAAADGIPCGTTTDWPELAWRGIHFLVGGHAAMPDLRKLIGETLPALRLNRVILEINYNFSFRSHPELVQPGALTLEDCRELRKLADESFVEIIPMINCLGHQSWAKQTFQLLKAHPELDETPDIPPDNPGIYCRSWCPSHPDVNRIVCSLIDDLIDAFQAKSFHVGMDEVFVIGQCPRCKGQSRADLFAKAVNDLHAHIAGKRRLQMLMWGDRLLDGEKMKLGEWEASKNGTFEAIDLIPKDIVMCDWHYETPPDFPSVPYFQEKGFRVLPSGWNRVKNVDLLTATMFKHRSPRMMGYLATTWFSLNGVVRALNGEKLPDARQKDTDLAGAIIAGARIAWHGR